MRKSLPLSICLALFTAAPAMAEPMTAADIEAKIIGQTFNARRGVMRARMTYALDGSVTLKTPVFTGGGTWRLAGNQLCVNITKGPGKGETCAAVTELGNGKYRASDGATLDSLEQ